MHIFIKFSTEKLESLLQELKEDLISNSKKYFAEIKGRILEVLLLKLLIIKLLI